MPSEPFWLPIPFVIAANQSLVADTGERHLLRDFGLLSSALSRPQTAWHYLGERDIVVLACRLAMGIARNHPFEQGNKRTAFAAAVTFIEANGCSFVWPDDPTVLATLVETGIRTKDDGLALASELRRYVEGPVLFSHEE